MLFVLGGNGTHAGANAIHDEVFNCLTLILVNCIYLDHFVIYDFLRKSSFWI